MPSVNLQVCIRCRPFASQDKLGVVMKEQEDGNSSIELVSPEDGQTYGHRYGFSKAWWSGSGYEKYTDPLSQSLIQQHQMQHITQEDVYAQVGTNMKAQFLNGHAVVMFAYGLSGSGKTFSVFGPDMAGLPEAWFNFKTPHRFWGVFPRLAYDIMTTEAKRRGGAWKFSIKYFQNVVDRIWDLLSGEEEEQEHASEGGGSLGSHHSKPRRGSVAPHAYKQGTNHKVEDRHINDGFHLDAHGFVDITWCRKKHIQSWHHLIETFKTANGKKAIAATQFNQASTRGHCILVFEADMPHPTKQGVRRTGRLYVCDLAGAEPAASVRDLGVNDTCWLYSLCNFEDRALLGQYRLGPRFFYTGMFCWCCCFLGEHKGKYMLNTDVFFFLPIRLIFLRCTVPNTNGS